ncbi:signal peptidase 22 kDa subunit [Myriangium duriaei CBS 260.36]|uniref:Signal peptidase subunit 3 n=1 Tax=Myriangium duriaei CBS 260.36 TaxID=1168546 RepID=A0A9P4MN85_9PEZI|nr:signal peptidase 22 kDa subunit [Myriangium duriaei CBS 260.36]
MHSSLIRLQNVFGFFTTVVFAVCAAISLSVLLHPQTPSAKLSLSNISVVKGRPNYYSTKKEEYAHIKFDLSADLTSLFSWNTKQIFIYIVAVLPSTHRSRNPAIPPSEAVIWDAIIPSPLAPWHANTYIHPGTTKSARQSRDRARMRASTPEKDRSKRLRTHDQTVDDFAAFPKGASSGIIKLSDQKPKYQVTTPAGRMAGLENCTLYLRYNVQPWVGALTWDTWPRTRHNEGKADRWWTPLWRRISGGQSRTFAMPGLKGAGTGTKKEDLGTETGGEANRGSPA